LNGIRQIILRKRLSDNFASGALREYPPGEEARAIDWRASASRGSIQLRGDEVQATLTWGAIIDRSRSMQAGRRRSLRDAANEAAAFWRGCKTPADRWVDVDPEGSFDFTRALARALHIMPVPGTLLAAGDFFELPQTPYRLLRAAARRFDCTALLARDPWHDNLMMGGFVTVADLETRARRRFFIGSRERSHFARAAQAREDAAINVFRAAGWRVTAFDESGGMQAVMRAFCVL